jgi:hypothetical protein
MSPSGSIDTFTPTRPALVVSVIVAIVAVTRAPRGD